jgi:hypothetical protein
MKPVGKTDAGNPHVRFDERGGETDRSRDTAPLLDSTGSILAFLGTACAVITSASKQEWNHRSHRYTQIIISSQPFPASYSSNHAERL